MISAAKFERLANLTNATSGNRTHGRYKIPGEDALREAAEKVATWLLEKAGATATIHRLRARGSVG